MLFEIWRIILLYRRNRTNVVHRQTVLELYYRTFEYYNRIDLILSRVMSKWRRVQNAFNLFAWFRHIFGAFFWTINVVVLEANHHTDCPLDYKQIYASNLTYIHLTHKTWKCFQYVTYFCVKLRFSLFCIIHDI